MPTTANLIAIDGPVPYGPANEAMHRLAERRLTGEIPDTVILLEHPPVFTAGRRARPAELRWTPDERAARLPGGGRAPGRRAGGAPPPGGPRPAPRSTASIAVERSRSTARGSSSGTRSSISALGRTRPHTFVGSKRW